MIDKWFLWCSCTASYKNVKNILRNNFINSVEIYNIEFLVGGFFSLTLVSYFFFSDFWCCVERNIRVFLKSQRFLHVRNTLEVWFLFQKRCVNALYVLSKLTSREVMEAVSTTYECFARMNVYSSWRKRRFYGGLY